MGMTDIVVDARLAGHQSEVWEGITTAAALSGVRAITVQPFCGHHVLSVAAEAAANCPLLTGHPKPPLILANIPAIAYRPFDLENLGMGGKRKDFVLQLVRVCYQAGLDGVIIEQRDVRATRHLIRQLQQERRQFVIMARAERGVQDYRIAMNEEEAKIPGIIEVLMAGAHHVVFDMNLASHDTEWTADLITKELATLKEQRRRRRRRTE